MKGIRYHQIDLFSVPSETSSPAFEEFLDLIGEKVKMKGFNKYRAQLDNKSKRINQLMCVITTCTCHRHCVC